MALLVLLAMLRQFLFTKEFVAVAAERESALQGYNTIIDNAAEGILRTTLDGRILKANQEFARIAGYESVEALTSAIATMTQLYVDPADRKAMLEHLSNEGAVRDHEVRLRRRDGAVRWVSVNLRSLPTAGGGQELHEFVRDITDTHQLAHDLKRTRRTLFVISQFNQALVRAADEEDLLQGVCDMLTKEGGYRLAWVGLANDDEERSVTPIAQSGFEAGYVAKVRATWAAEDPRGQGPTGRVIREERTQIAQDIFTDPAMAPWRADALARGYAASCSLLLDLAPYGRGALMVYAAEPAAFGPDEVKLLEELAGDLTYGVVSLRDRQAKKVAEAQRAAAQTNYRALFENMTEGFAHCRMLFESGVAVDWEYLEVNKVFGSLTGLQDVVGKRVSQIVPGIRTANPDLFDAYARVAAGGPPEKVESYVPGLDRWFAISAYAAGRDEFVAVVDNITERKRSVDALMRSERRLREAEAVARVGGWEFVVAGSEFSFSDEAARIFGLQPGLASWDDFVASVHAQDRARVEATLNGALAGGLPHEHEFRVVLPNGDVRHVKGMGPAPDMAQGKPVRISGILQDVTQEKASLEAVAKSESRLREAQRVAQVGSWELDLVKDKLLWSDENYRVFGVEPGAVEATYEFFLATVHPDDRAAVHEAYTTSVANRTPYGIDHRLLMADGKVKWVHERCETFYDADGKPLKSVGTTQDITDRVLDAQKLRRSEELLKETQHLAKIAGWSYEPGTKQFTATEELARIFEMDTDQKGFTPQSFIDRVAGEDRERMATAFARAVDHGTGYDVEVAIVTGKGRRKVIHTVGKAEFLEGRVVRVFGHVIDVTAEKAAEEAREALALQKRELARLQDLNKMRMEFLNTAAHDLKTPLTPLKLEMATMRLRGKLDPRQKDSLELMDRNLNRFQVLVEDMLDAARLQSGRLRLRREALLVAPLVKEAVASFQESARQANLAVQVDPMPEVRIDADPTKAMQVLMNLVSNAVKYTPVGGWVRIHVESGPKEVLLSVRDSGLGMTAEQLGKLFQAFVRLHEDKPGIAKGTGLGLYISKGIVEQHGGRIWAESEGPGKGSTFHVAWPLAGPGTPAPPPSPAPAAA